MVCVPFPTRVRWLYVSVSGVMPARTARWLMPAMAALSRCGNVAQRAPFSDILKSVSPHTMEMLMGCPLVRGPRGWCCSAPQPPLCLLFNTTLLTLNLGTDCMIC